MSTKVQDPRKHCEQANRLLKTDSSKQTFMMRAKQAVGKTLGQAAFNRIQDAVPRAQVDQNTNAGVRRLVDAVNRGNLSFAGKSINFVSRQVLDTAGINPNVVPADPNGKNIYDNGIVAAETLGEALIVGAVDEADLPGPISDLSVLANLQQTQAQEEFNLDVTDPECGVSAYARDLIPYAPKFNYMFMVSITFQPDYVDLGLQENGQIQQPEEIKFQYLCRQFTRPDINIEYEDVNMYNFRTKIPKRTDYAPVSLRLYDDNKNSSMVFLEKYLKARSSIARKHVEQQDTFETQGMDFTPYNSNDGQTGTNIDQLVNSSASLESLVNENRSILRRVDVYHVFNYGQQVNQYSFLNPKVLHFDISDFDMDEGIQASTIGMQLAYDSMFIQTDVDVDINNIKERSKLGTRAMLRYQN